MHKCSKCHSSFEGKFCPSCGEKWVPLTCPSCHSEVPDGAQFCNECGAPLQSNQTDGSTEKQPEKKSFVQGAKDFFAGKGHCQSCIYFDKTQSTLFHDGRCLYLDKSVNTDGSCNGYSEKATKSNSGYKSGGCFLTSACVEYLGKPDDCEELTALRRFRDGYMAQTDEGKALISEYYEVAPAIVDKINASPRKSDTYSYIYSVIRNCMAHIDSGKNQDAVHAYKDMVLKLKSDFLLPCVD